MRRDPEESSIGGRFARSGRGGENFTHPIREELKEEDQEPEEPMTQEATTQEEWDSLSASSLEPMPEAPET